MENRVLERLRKVLKENKVSQRDLATKLKISLSTVNKLLNNEGDLNIYILREIAKVLGVSEQWILIGDIDSKGTVSSVDKEEFEDLKQNYKLLEEENRRLKNAPQKRTAAVGSEVTFVDSQSLLTYPKEYKKSGFVEQFSKFTLPPARFPKNYRAFEVNGDAMREKINAGDWVICEKVEDLNTIKDRFTYMIVLEHEVQCCRVLNRIKERDRIRLKFDNKSYRDIEIHTNQIKEVWEIKSLMTFSLTNPNFQLEDWVKKLEDRIFDLEEKERRRDEGGTRG